LRRFSLDDGTPPIDMYNKVMLYTYIKEYHGRYIHKKEKKKKERKICVSLYRGIGSEWPENGSEPIPLCPSELLRLPLILLYSVDDAAMRETV